MIIFNIYMKDINLLIKDLEGELDPELKNITLSALSKDDTVLDKIYNSIVCGFSKINIELTPFQFEYSQNPDFQVVCFAQLKFSNYFFHRNCYFSISSDFKIKKYYIEEISKTSFLNPCETIEL